MIQNYNMNYRLKKVAVLGSGVMGSGIACHLANVGMEVMMLDIVTPNLDGDQLKDKVQRKVRRQPMFLMPCQSSMKMVFR